MIFFTVPLKLTRTYKRYNTDIECPSFGSPQMQSTPNSNFKLPLKKNTLPVNYAKKVLFHYENEKPTSQSTNQKEKKVTKLDNLVEKNEPGKNEEVKIQIDEEACASKYWKKVTTIAEIHKIPEDYEPTQYIKVENNAKEMGVSVEMMKVLGHEVDEIMSESSDSDLSNTATSKPYLFIKSKESYSDDESLIEAILFSNSSERICI